MAASVSSSRCYASGYVYLCLCFAHTAHLLKIERVRGQHVQAECHSVQFPSGSSVVWYPGPPIRKIKSKVFGHRPTIIDFIAHRSLRHKQNE